MSCKVLVLLIIVIFSQEKINGKLYYVISKSSLLNVCPRQPCHTLEEYVQDSAKYFKSDTQFIFLPGFHTLLLPLHLSDISNVSLKRYTDTGSLTVMCFERLVVTNVDNLKIERLNLVRYFENSMENSSLVTLNNSREITISYDTFQGMNKTGQAIYAILSSVTVIGCLFVGHSDQNGGAIFVNNTNLTITGSSFIRNEAKNKGGAVYARNSRVNLLGDEVIIFSHNTGCTECFHNSSLECNEGNGGALTVEDGFLTTSGNITFTENKANIGGAIALFNTSFDAAQSNLTFIRNLAIIKGGGMHMKQSTVTGTDQNMTFISNTAKGFSPFVGKCAALCIFNTNSKPRSSVMTPTLYNNSGDYGGAVFAERTLHGFILNSVYAHGNSDTTPIGFFYTTSSINGTNLYFNNKGKGAININNANITLQGANHFINNAGSNGAIGIFNHSRVALEGKAEFLNNHGLQGGGAITIILSELSFRHGEVIICENVGDTGGGGINAFSSNIFLNGNILFCRNSGHKGGAMGMISDQNSRLEMSGVVIFDSNTAMLGGALHASGISMTLSGVANFSSNTASTGGALYVEFMSVLNMNKNASLLTAGNEAADYGGAIFHEDSVTDLQCSNITELYRQQKQVWALPTAFLQVESTKYCPTIASVNDYAGKDGSFLYGGLLDRSRMKDDTTRLPFHFFTKHCFINISSSNDKNPIASDPYQLKFCNNSSLDIHNSSRNVSVYRGQSFWLDMAAIGQGDYLVQATVVVITNSSALLNLNQNTQFTGRNCSRLKFNLFSELNESNAMETMMLYPNGLCQTVADSVTTIYVHLMTCPDAFVQSGDRCDCEPRLRRYANCSIEDRVFISQSAGPKIWMNGLYNKSGSYKGLILYPKCPINYCMQQKSDIYLDSPDVQCVFKRSGVLCGKCASNYSLLLGDSQCGICSNYYLGLILVFALAGPSLSLFLSLSGLSVSSGALNGFIFYSNLIQANKILFFSDRTNPLTVFVAWISMDFGFNVCLYNGMDAYAKTWLQYVFPVYTLALTGIVIITGQRYRLVSKIVGPHPIAAFATLLLLLYNKILKVIIDVFFFVSLEYPGEKYVMVWLKDGSVLYLHVKHLILTLFTVTALILLFTPYTVFILLGQCLFRVPNRKFLQVLNKIKPILQMYYSPYKPKTRYWTGLLLLLRCLLFLVFSCNALGGSRYSLLAIIVSVSAISALSWLNKGIYKDFHNDVIEISLYLNLIILSAISATLSKSKAAIVGDALVAVAFVSFLGVLLRHFHVSYFHSTTIYGHIKRAVLRFKSSNESEPLVDNNSMPEPNVVSHTEVRVTPRQQ